MAKIKILNNKLKIVKVGGGTGKGCKNAQTTIKPDKQWKIYNDNKIWRR